MERQEFKDNVRHVKKYFIDMPDTLYLAATEKPIHVRDVIGNKYSKYKNDEEAERIINCIQHNLLAVKNLTKILRSMTTDVEYPIGETSATDKDRGLRLAEISIEELTELALAITSKIKPSGTYDYYDGLEEYVDVQICMPFIRQYLDLQDHHSIEAATIVKSDRVKNIISKKGSYE